MNTERIAKYIKLLRQKKNLTQSDVAALCNVTSQAVSKWEKGTSIPDVEALKTLSEFYGVSINKLLDGGKVVKHNAVDQQKVVGSLGLTMVAFLAFFMRFTEVRIPGLAARDQYFGMEVFIEGGFVLTANLIRLQVIAIVLVFSLHVLTLVGVLKVKKHFIYGIMPLVLLVLLIGFYATSARLFFVGPQLVIAFGLGMTTALHGVNPLTFINNWVSKPMRGANSHSYDVMDYGMLLSLVLINALFLIEAFSRLFQGISLIATAIPLSMFFRNILFYPLGLLAVFSFNVRVIMRFRNNYNHKYLIVLFGVNAFVVSLFYTVGYGDRRFFMIWRPASIESLVIVSVCLVLSLLSCVLSIIKSRAC